MRVSVIEFGMNVAYDVPGQLPGFKRKFEAPEHTMEWLPEDQALVIDGWWHTPTAGTRWRSLGLPLPADKKGPDAGDQPGPTAGPARRKTRRR